MQEFGVFCKISRVLNFSIDVYWLILCLEGWKGK